MHRCQAHTRGLEPAFIRSPRNTQTNPVLLMESSGLLQPVAVDHQRPLAVEQANFAEWLLHVRALPIAIPTASTRCPANPYSMQGEYGPSSLDERNRVFIGGTITATVGTAAGAVFHRQFRRAIQHHHRHRPLWHPLTSTLFNERPGIATSSTPGAIHTPYGWLDPNPKPGEAILPRNFGRSPGSVSLNFRLAKTFGFGGIARELRPGTTISDLAVVAGRGGGGRGPGGGGPGGGGFGGGPGGGPGGILPRISSGGSTGQRYNLTISVQARNLLNHVNPGPINGILTSPFLANRTTLAGGFGAFAQSGTEPPHRFAGAIHVLRPGPARDARLL